ncbi:MAG: endolysin A [Caudoviricetes sp.]|nr:MAG: endolysin A [Caudoviricetes sp.]UXN80208.1 MAG: endolysin A [Caudoviricetes sp.]
MKEVLKTIQTALKSTGLYSGSIDGVFGWNSYNAAIELSKAKGKNKQTIKEIQQILADQRVYFGAIDGDFGGGSMSGLNSLMPAPKITDALLQAAYKGCAPGFAQYINQHAEAFHIKTKADLLAFLANNIHESQGFKKLRENMNYRAPNLQKTFKKYFSSVAAAQAAINAGQVALCDIVYGGRMGNGKNNGDGFKYRGGGTIHLTGKENYQLCSIGIGLGNALLNDPDMITKPEYAMKSAMWFWRKNLCSRHANHGDFEQVCRIVNGGTNGLDERNILHKKLWNTIF